MRDADGDGLAAWQEYDTDTDPTNRASVLRLRAIAPVPGGIRLDWQGGQQVLQRIEWRDNLRDTVTPWQILFTNVPPTASSTNYTDAAGSVPARVYRLTVDPRP